MPVVQISGNTQVDTCSSVLLDGSSSYDHGFRGTFEWQLFTTNPAVTDAHKQHIEALITNYQDQQGMLQGLDDYDATLG